ncbi:17467_t:CDS:2 [Funneliformis geosporum]|uniref:17467_t:CDS:1 n=1 Tax=Funneliformis geosporum TaxID=1117311 RepID=A0A9W4SMX7_9GLOM|nr:17467_t:CDS:2 [Funneliformis geosporum]
MVNKQLFISSIFKNATPDNIENFKSFNTILHENISDNKILLQLEKDGYNTLDKKAKKLITKLTEIKYLFALKLLFECSLNQFSPQVLRDSLVALVDSTSFNYYAKQSMIRLELHVRIWVAVLEQICITPMCLSKELRDRVYNSLARFSEIHRRTTHVMQEGIDNNYNSDFNQFNQGNIADEEEKIKRRTKDLLKIVLNITLSIVAPQLTINNDNYSILSMITQLRQGLTFKYSSESSEKVISRKFALKNIGSLLNDLSSNEPLALPYTLWFRILDLAYNLIKKSSRTATYELCYYLAIESLNKASSNFIQFKAVEILLYLHNINSELFSMIELDLDQYAQKLKENSTSECSKHFQNILTFIKSKYLDDINKLNDDIGKGKSKVIRIDQNTHLKKERISNLYDIIDIIAYEMTCPISQEPADQLFILKCHHEISMNNLKVLKQKKSLKCPQCRKDIDEKDIRYLPQTTVYKSLYLYLIEAGHISLNQIQINHDDSDFESAKVGTLF